MRKDAKMTQVELATLLGITFQQVQKYELGHNRISADRIQDIHMATGWPIMGFFNGLPSPPPEIDQTDLGWVVKKTHEYIKENPDYLRTLAVTDMLERVDIPDHVEVYWDELPEGYKVAQ